MSSLLDKLAPFESVRNMPPGEVVFEEGAAADGVYLLHSGEVDLTFAAPRANKAPHLKATPGQLLGVSCVVAGRNHDCSALTRTECVAGFVDRGRFLGLLESEPDLWMPVLRLISTDIGACWDCVRNLR